MKALSVAQIIVSLLLAVSILLQSRGAGLSAAFGGDFGGYYTKRGFEKFLLYFSAGFSALFIILAAASVFLAR